MSETQLSRSVQTALEAIGCVVVRVQAGELRGAGGHHVQGAMPGTPDLYVIGPRLPATGGSWSGWLELKMPAAVLNSHQVAWHAMAKSRGVNVETVRSVEAALRIVTGRAT